MDAHALARTRRLRGTTNAATDRLYEQLHDGYRDFSALLARDVVAELCGGAQRQKARALAQGEDPDGDAANLDVLGALQKFSQARPHPEAFVDALEPLQPRLYSISSSPKHSPGRLTLTVDAVRYVIRKRKRFGID
jgi:sulfite reductase (NADPH) flavoprotein alpha-component